MAETATQIEQIEPEVKDPFNVDNLLTSTDVAKLWETKSETKEETKGEVTETTAEVQPIVEEPKQEVPPQLTFANEESERIYNLLREGKRDEIRQYLNDLDLYSNTDKMKADEAIRLQLQKSDPNLTKEDIQDIMEEKYYVPEKPERDIVDLDEDYEAKISRWQSQVEKINRRIERDARTARQQLSGQIKDIVLPEINTQQEQNQLSPEEWQNIDNIRKEYLKQLDATTKDSLGFDARYKDDEVEIPVSYRIPDEYKREMKQRLENFDLQSYFEQRYFTDKGIDAKKLMNDIFLLEHPELVFNGIATTAGTERFVAAEKARKNIKIDGNSNGNISITNDSLMDRLAKKMLTS